MTPFNKSAVMAHRNEPPDSLDFFPTPPWATRAFLRHVLPALGVSAPHICSAWDPACGEGHMSEVLAEKIAFVRASDIFDYGKGYVVADFLDAGTIVVPSVDLICSNPPFNAALSFVLRALGLAPVVAMLLRTGWQHGDARYRELFSLRPPSLIAAYVERVPMHRGRWEPDGSTATDYSWFVWAEGVPPLPPLWIPPGCRRALTKHDDAARFGVLAPAPLLDLVG